DSVIYGVSAITYAVDYIWDLPPGATIISGDSTNSIMINFSASATSGDITVYATNLCGDGAVSPVFTVTVDPLPVQAGNITGTSVLCEGTSGVTFSVPPVTYATGYTWELPPGAIIVGPSDTNVIVVDFTVGAVSGDVAVYGTNDCGSGLPSAFPVTINQNPDAVITGDTEICMKDTVTLTAAGGTDYLWNTGATTATVSYIITTDITYYVIVTEASTGCSDTASVSITMHNVPTVSAGSDKEICYGEECNLNASTTGGISFLWTPSSGLSNDTIANPIASPELTTLYTVEVWNVFGCSNEDSVLVTVHPLPQITVSRTNVRCYGLNNGTASVTVDIEDYPPYTNIWLDASENVISTNDTISSLSPGVYVVIVTDGQGCSVSQAVGITQPDLLTINLSGYSTDCYGSHDGWAVAQVAGGTQPYSITWNDNNSTVNDTVTGLSPDVWYEVVVIDANICMKFDSVKVSSPTQIVPLISSATDASCYGGSDGSASVSSTGGTGSHHYVWSDPSGQTTATASGLTADNYQVTVSDANGCTSLISVTINVPEMLVIDFDTVSTSCIDADDGAITLTVTGGIRPYNYTWDGYSVNDSVLTELFSGTYSVTVTDAHLCPVYEDITVYRGQSPCLDIPTAFTPNGDDIHDTWEIKGIQFYPGAVVQVFNRWGDKVYESENYANEPWDGTSKNGKKLPVGPYLYIITIDGTEVPPKTVTIIR
ncbi:MAG: gliding motility-associated C-terminal domain-containing protein, partial [Bacteroidetes bacterium]|nr:gliding motility-associated C-terminal domain-containing protein [Bacteroidota bacterium]